MTGKLTYDPMYSAYTPFKLGKAAARVRLISPSRESCAESCVELAIRQPECLE